MLKILLEENVAEEEEEEEISEEGGENKLKLKNLIFIAYTAIKTGMMYLHVRRDAKPRCCPYSSHLHLHFHAASTPQTITEANFEAQTTRDCSHLTI